MNLQSYVAGGWHEGTGDPVVVNDAITGETVCGVNSDGIDFAAVVRHGRAAGEALRAMTFHDRAARLKAAPATAAS